MKILIFVLLGGVNEVGGNWVLLEDFSYDVKIFLDFGVKIDKFKENYKDGQHPSSIKEYAKNLIKPNIIE